MKIITEFQIEAISSKLAKVTFTAQDNSKLSTTLNSQDYDLRAKDEKKLLALEAFNQLQQKGHSLINYLNR